MTAKVGIENPHRSHVNSGAVGWDEQIIFPEKKHVWKGSWRVTTSLDIGDESNLLGLYILYI